MTVLATRPRTAAALPAARPARTRRPLPGIAGAILRWAVAIVLIVVLGELLTPIEARAAVRSGAVTY